MPISSPSPLSPLPDAEPPQAVRANEASTRAVVGTARFLRRTEGLLGGAGRRARRGKLEDQTVVGHSTLASIDAVPAHVRLVSSDTPRAQGAGPDPTDRRYAPVMAWKGTHITAAPIGWDAHERGVERLRASYDAIPPGAPVRLAKRTSNLFRARSGTDTPGLDVSGLAGVVQVDPESRTADVQGMCTYET